MVVLGDSSPICLGKTEREIGHQQLERYQQEAWQALKSEEIGSVTLVIPSKQTPLKSRVFQDGKLRGKGI